MNRRPDPAPAAALVSDLTSFATVGLDGRSFLRFLRNHDVAHVKVGRRVLARLDDLVATFDRISGRAPERLKSNVVAFDEASLIERAARGRR